jgi:hypothetical protein
MTAFETFLKYFGVVMPLCYVAFGGYVIWRYQSFFNLPPSYSVTLGIVLMLYGLYRCYRAYKQAFKD